MGFASYAALLDFQKFLPKYSENQKWASPLIRLLSQTPSPRGEGYEIDRQISDRKRDAPLITAASRQSFPPRGSLYQRLKLKFQTNCGNPLRNTLRVRYETPCGCVTKRVMPAPRERF